MGIFSKLLGKDINKGVEEFNASAEGWLLDVRAKHEYDAGHIPGAKSVPLPGPGAGVAGAVMATSPAFRCKRRCLRCHGRW